MVRLWNWLQSRRRCVRQTLKLLLMTLVVFAVLYPRPVLFLRHMRHLQDMDALSDPDCPALAPVAAQLEIDLLAQGIDPTAPDQRVLSAVERFVYDYVDYDWDWNVWGSVDYLPHVSEVIERRVEDCDGRAVLAVALLRRLGVEAGLTGDTRHMWVGTEMGQTMGPLGQPVFEVKDDKLRIRWLRLADIGPFGFGVAAFPWFRELIIVSAAWILVLPLRPYWPRAFSGAVLILAGLLVVRISGSAPTEPVRSGIWLGLGLAVVGLFVSATRGCIDTKTYRPVGM